jgi:DNA-binding IclR family transcriptional regulator
MTGTTITDHAQLRTRLESVRAEGVAYEDEEAIFGECGVAAPLLEPARPSTRGRAVRPHAAGAIGLVVPSTQWPLDQEPTTGSESPLAPSPASSAHRLPTPR